MQYLQNEPLTNIWCQIEPDLQLFEIFVWSKNVTFIFHTAISRMLIDLFNYNLACVSF